MASVCDSELNMTLTGEVSELARLLGSKEAAVDFMIRDIKNRKRTLLLEVKAYESVIEDMAEFSKLTDNPFLHFLVQDNKGRIKKASVGQRSNVIQKEAQLKIAEILIELRPKIHGGVGRNKALNRNIAKEMAGEATGDAIAKNGAKQIKEVLDDLIDQFNKLGGDIKKIDNYGLPQSHNRFLMQKAGKEDWIEFVKSRLDITKIRQAYPNLDLDDALEFMYKQKVDGVEPRPKSGSPLDTNTARMADGRRQQRFLHFKNEEMQFEYNEKFGTAQGDSSGVILAHIEQMSNEIAMMERFGPDPIGMVDRLAKNNEINFKDSAVKGGLAKNDDVWAVINGTANEAGSAKWAARFSAARNLMTAAHLGSAAIASVTDVGSTVFNSIQRGIGGMGVISKVFSRVNAKEAAHLGIILETTTSRVSALSRFSGDADDIAGGVMQWFAEKTVRLTGLSGWTAKMKKSFQLQVSNYFGKMANKPFEQLSSRNRRLFNEYDMSPAEWNSIRMHTENVKGNTYMSYRNMPNGTAKQKWLNIMESEVDYAVPTPDARIRAIVTQGEKRGTLKGESARFVGQFKAFPLTIFGRILPKLNRKGDRGLLAGYLTTTTLLGFMAIQAKQVAAGKELIDITNLDEEQWAALMVQSMIQGGGLGIFGDIFLSALEADGYQGNLLLDIVGPAYGDLGKLTEATFGNLLDLFKGKETSFIPDILKFIQTTLPANNWWMTKALYNELWNEFILSVFDPKYKEKLRRKKKRLRDQYGQDYL